MICIQRLSIQALSVRWQWRYTRIGTERIMNKAEVIRLLKANKNDRGIGHWNRLYSNSRLKSFGIGLTVLRKLAKQIGRDRHLSMKLWDSEVYDARVISMLIDDPKQITREQAEQQVEQMGEGQLMHVFSSCGASLAKVPYSLELADDWISTKDEKRKQCGYGLLYEISKSKKKTAPDDNFFLGHINLIDKTYKKQSIDVLMSMAGALLGIGKRNKKLNKAALKVAKAIGPIDFSADGSCDPFDVVKHLESEWLRKKLLI